jgi:hypothetical protein
MWGWFAIQQCMLTSTHYRALALITYLSALCSIWIFCIFIGQIAMIASETTTFEQIRRNNFGKHPCTIRGLFNIGYFCKTGDYLVDDITWKSEMTMKNKMYSEATNSTERRYDSNNDTEAAEDSHLLADDNHHHQQQQQQQQKHSHNHGSSCNCNHNHSQSKQIV